ncbi:MAG: hypothetical protein WBX15_00655 [Thermoanaerobaculia bacterium]
MKTELVETRDSALHREDVTRSSRSVEQQPDVTDPGALHSDLVMIPAPGHTRGHVVCLYEGKLLFPGDHLASGSSRGAAVRIQECVRVVVRAAAGVDAASVVSASSGCCRGTDIRIAPEVMERSPRDASAGCDRTETKVVRRVLAVVDCIDPGRSRTLRHWTAADRESPTATST